MANESREWPRNGEGRMNLFSGRSRSVGSFRSAHMESNSNNRLSEYPCFRICRVLGPLMIHIITYCVIVLGEPRLSIGAGIRDLERRTAEVPTILRNNINNVIEELRPIMERARTNTDNIMSVNNNGNVTLASWLSNSHQPAIAAPRDSNEATVATGSYLMIYLRE